MQISLERIVKVVVDEVVKALAEKGVIIADKGPLSYGNGLTSTEKGGSCERLKIEQIDFSMYRTPVITGSTVDALHELTGGIKIPAGTIITPGAKEKLKKKKVKIYYKQEVG